MQPSAPSTDLPGAARRRRGHEGGFSLLEVMIAATLLVILLGIALSQIGETSDAAAQATANADLRRIGTDALARIVNDLRSTQAQYVTASASEIGLVRVVAFDPVKQVPILEQSSGSLVYTYYGSVPSTDVTTPDTLHNVHGMLHFKRFTTSTTFVDTHLSRELAVDTSNNSIGVSVTASSPSATIALQPVGITTASTTFANQPVILSVRLMLARQIGIRGTGQKQFATASLETQVQLRANGAGGY